MERLFESFAEVEIPQEFRVFVPAALMRLQVIHPTLEFSRDADLVVVGGPNSFDPTEIRKSVLHSIYREKIYAETLPLRQSLVAAVTAK
jgi:hypothetical protein